MKIISLNTWRGKLYEPQLQLLHSLKDEADIFCLQEVCNGDCKVPNEKGAVTDMYTQYTNLLSGFTGFFAASGDYNVSGTKVPYGLAMFVRNVLEIKDYGVKEIFRLNDDGIDLPPGILLWNRLLQFTTLTYKGKPVTIYNFHGLYTGGGKDDTQSRITQSERVADILKNQAGEKILCGDFNLNPNTRSLALLKEGMRDLIRENNIATTRSHYYLKDMKFADYTLVSENVEVKKFEVLPDVVSDHLPMVLEIG